MQAACATWVRSPPWRCAPFAWPTRTRRRAGWRRRRGHAESSPRRGAAGAPGSPRRRAGRTTAYFQPTAGRLVAATAYRWLAAAMAAVADSRRLALAAMRSARTGATLTPAAGRRSVATSTAPAARHA
eukprot:scaffold102123_cov51-Phaeocystis_antarctica.AAC.2